MTTRLTIADLIEATGATPLRGDPGCPVESISTDTRELSPGQWFVALHGPNFNANDFIPEALERGAAGIIAAGDDIPPLEAMGSVPVLRVDDTLRAYGDIARAWRRAIEPSVACVAGSSGKTTTKEMAARLLSERADALVTEGNFNNLVGLPKTLLRLEEGHRYVLAEIGMNSPGELERLTTIAEPEIAALTNVGLAHVGMFGSIEKLMRAKAELLIAMKPGATLISNADCIRSAEIVDRFASHLNVVRFGLACRAPYRAEAIASLKPWGYRFDFVCSSGSREVRLPIFGRHNVANALCALALLCEWGFRPQQAVAAIERFESAPMRSSIVQKGGVIVIEDCYNASPDGMIKTLESLADLQASGRRHLVLGDMLELGDAEEELHRRVGRSAAKVDRAIVYGVGDRAKWIVEAARARRARAKWFDSSDDAAKALNAAVASEDVVLIKASRRMQFERIAAALEKHLS